MRGYSSTVLGLVGLGNNNNNNNIVIIIAFLLDLRIERILRCPGPGPRAPHSDQGGEADTAGSLQGEGHAAAPHTGGWVAGARVMLDCWTGGVRSGGHLIQSQNLMPWFPLPMPLFSLPMPWFPLPMPWFPLLSIYSFLTNH